MRCPYCGSMLYAGRCDFWLCKGDGHYSAIIRRAREDEAADALGLPLQERTPLRSPERTPFKGAKS